MTEEFASTVIPFPGAISRQHQPPKLLDRVRIAIRTRHYSLRTEEAYVGWIRRFIFFHGKRLRCARRRALSRWAEHRHHLMSRPGC
jgi:integrase-like protein